MALPAKAVPTPPRPSRPSRSWPAMVASWLVVLAAGFAFWALRVPMAAGFDQWWPLPPPPPPPEAPAELPPSLKVDPTEKKPEWTAVQVGDALRRIPDQLNALLEEGRGELRQLADPTAGDQVARQRALVHWRAWSRTWQNRAALIEKAFPPPEACAKDPAKVPLCRGLAPLVTRARDLPRFQTPAAARRALDQLDQDLETLLHPPAPGG